MKLDVGKYVVGDQLTIYDFQVAGFFTNVVLNPHSRDYELWQESFKDASPQIREYVADFQKDMKDYLDDREEKKYECKL